MRIALSTVALVGLAQATSLTSQVEIMTEAGHCTGKPEYIFPPGLDNYNSDQIRQARHNYDCLTLQ